MMNMKKSSDEYINTNITSNFFLKDEEVKNQLKEFPYLDTNDAYYHSFVENF